MVKAELKGRDLVAITPEYQSHEHSAKRSVNKKPNPRLERPNLADPKSKRLTLIRRAKTTAGFAGNTQI